MRTAVAAAGVAVVLGAAAVAAVALGGGSTPPPQAAAQRFLGGYVEADGRVVRRDQGGDTVSEGQAYALLLSVAVGDGARFARVWGWTRAHLLRHDGLLAWRWADGRVADTQAAGDADLDTARALVLAADRFGVPAYRTAARRLGAAVLRGETTVSGGDPVLSPGPWAVSSRVVNPSYFSPRAYALLGGHDRRWRGLAASSRRLVGKLTSGGLPPDWAQLQPYGITPAGSPGGGVAPRYAYDALRVPLRFAESCAAADRALAARLWPRLRDVPGAPARGLDGTPSPGPESPAALAAAAAAAWAAGDRGAASGLLDRADAVDREHPTYYGAAWAALARIMLQTRTLGRCGRVP
jgi:endoglucanase